MIVLKLILFMLFIVVSKCRIPDKVFCATKGCDGPISKAKTLLSYSSPDPDLISFRPNSEAIVYMKSAGTHSDLWFVNISGKTGFVPSKFLREYKVIEKNPQEIVSYPIINENIVQPDKVLQAHEVFEGTTIYTTEAALHNAYQDATTEAPLTSSNDDLTPILNSATEKPNENVQNTVPHVSSQQDNEVKSESKSSENIKTNPVNTEDPSEITSSSEISLQIDEEVLGDLDDETESEELLEEAISKPVVTPEQNVPMNIESVNEKLPLDKTSETPPPKQFISSSSGSLNADLTELPEKQDLLQSTLQETDSSESNEKNTSTLNNIVENLSITTDSPTEPNGKSLNEPVVSKIDDSVDSTVIENMGDTNGAPIESLITNPIDSTTTLPPDTSTIVPHFVPPLIEPVVPVVNEPVVPPVNEPIVDPVQQVIPPIYINDDTSNQYVQVNNIETAKKNINSGLDTLPIETLPTITPVPATSTEAPMEPVTSTTETIPAYFSEDQSTKTTEEAPPIMELEIPITTANPSYEDTYSTTPVPYISEESFYQSGETTTSPVEEYSSADVAVEDIIAALPDPPEDVSTTTEAPVSENTEGIISNLYSTVADLWPSSTEKPESIYNPEYPTYESEIAEDEGFSFMKYLKSTYYSVMGTSEETKALFASVGEKCFSNEYCDGTSNDGRNRLLTFLLTTASSVLLFTLGYYYIDNRRQDGQLIGTINSLQRDLLFATKECEILKEELSSTKNKLAGIEDSSFGMDDMVLSLKEEINELKATNDRLRNSLDDNEKLLRVSENTAGELQNTLSEVENTLSELLAERANSEEQIVELNGKIQAFEEELISVSRDRDSFQLKYVSAESALEDFKKQKRQLEEVNEQLADAKNTIELQKHEIEALKEAIKELKSGLSSDVDVTSFIDHTEIKAKLSKALQEKNSYETKYEAEHKERARLEEELKASQDTLATTNQSATEALTRLEVLGKYFQERESELLKELSAKESLWLSKQGESASTVEKIELLQQEIQRYKEKCDALTLELAEQESSRRVALGEAEARAHQAWLQARGARRDAELARDDAATLRRKLAALTALSDAAVSPLHKVSPAPDSAESAALPPLPLFLPPPLLPPLPRPPPLGRLPSPHPPRYGDRRYSPDSRYSPESRYSPDSRYSPETVRYSPDSRYSPRSRRSPYSPRSRRRSRSRERYEENRGSRSRNGPAPPDTETEYNSDSPSRQPRRRYSRRSGPSSGSGCSSESDK